jgi:hypothetical protein
MTMHFAAFEGIWFVEGRPASTRPIERVEVKLGGVLRSGQLKSLDDVKRIMTRTVRARGGNSVVDFAYGQRSVGIIASIFNRDDVVWYGTGTVANIDPSELG